MAVLAACITMLPAGAAVAGCATFTGGSITATYDPLGAQSVFGLAEPIPLFVQRNPTGSSPQPVAVAAQVIAQYGQQLNNFTLGSASGPNYFVSAFDGTRPIVGEGGAPLQALQYFEVPFFGSQAQAVPGLLLVIPPGQDIPYGTYQESLIIRYACLSANEPVQNAGAEMQTAVVSVTITVPEKISANLAGGGSYGDVDFGDFGQLSQRVQVQVRGTGPYHVAITSQNAGKMRMLAAPIGATPSTTSIAYSLSFGGRSVTLGSPSSFDRPGVFGQSEDLVVTADPVTQNRAGYYKDTLTVTFTPS
jgi:spore coat protein U-like protein